MTPSEHRVALQRYRGVIYNRVRAVKAWSRWFPWIEHEDLVQEAQIAALEAVASMREGFEGNDSNYVGRCVRNRLHDYMRSCDSRTRSQIESHERMPEHVDVDGNYGVSTCPDMERALDVRRALRRHSATSHQVEALAALALDPRCPDDIAAERGHSTNRLYQLRARAIEHITHALEGEKS